MELVSRKKPRSKSRAKKDRPVTWGVSKGRCKGGGQSSKAKGRAAVQQVRELLLAWFPLYDNDIHVKATSQGGCDLHLSHNAERFFPFDIEVKNVEALNIHKALAQAQNNAEKGKKPIVFFKRSHTPLFIAMKAADFLQILAKE